MKEKCWRMNWQTYFNKWFNLIVVIINIGKAINAHKKVHNCVQCTNATHLSKSWHVLKYYRNSHCFFPGNNTVICNCSYKQYEKVIYIITSCPMQGNHVFNSTIPAISHNTALFLPSNQIVWLKTWHNYIVQISITFLKIERTPHIKFQTESRIQTL